MLLSDNLQHLMRIHGNISVSELARLADIPQPTIHHILTGSTKNPRKKALESLSRFFSVSVQQLTGREQLPAVIPNVIKEDLHISTVPLIEWDMLYNWPVTASEITDSKEILLDKKIAPNSFALIAKDSSLEPTIPCNALLIFEAGRVNKNKDIVVAYLGRDKSIMFNSLYQDNNQNYLKQNQEDGNVKLIRLDPAHDRILGTLIEARIVY